MERLSKRLRIIPAPATDVRRNCYLDTVPEEILRVVLRYLSRRPKHENWHTYISARSVDTVLEVGSTLERAALIEFHRIGGKYGIHPGNTPDVTILRSLVSRLPLRSLVLQLPGEYLLSSLLPTCGDELRELVLHTTHISMTQSDILAISTYRTKLTSLAIVGESVEGPLTPIWRSIGSTLTGLYIGCDYSAAGFRFLDLVSAHDLVEYCKNLHHVVVQTWNYHIANILAALGSRIRVLGIKEPPYLTRADWHNWRKVYAACTNLQAIHSAVYGSFALDSLSLICTKLVSLTLHDSNYQIPIGDRFFSVLPQCSVLRKVKLGRFRLPLEALRKFFESLKSVTTLTWDMSFSNVNPMRDVIDVVACNLRNLESLTISTHEPLTGEDVKALVSLPHLKSVTLQSKFTMKSVSVSKPSECAVEVMKTFKDCARLVRLEISGVIQLFWYRCQIAQAAAMYKRKDFDMFIGGVQFRTW